MWRRAFPLLLLIAIPAAASAALPVHVGGRAVQEADGSWRFGWPGVYFESRFRGTAVSVDAVPGADRLRLSIDGAVRAELIGPGEVRLDISGLDPGDHVVRLDKVTESQEGSSRFIGFSTDPEATPLDPPARTREIEFVGDSYTVGYGDTAHGPACTRAEVHDTTDTSQAFGPLAARRLDADYRIIAFSGFGVVRNYDGVAPGLSLPAIYGRAIPGETMPWDAARDAWRPQLIVIALGANDFSTDLHPGERWANRDALRADWRARYVAFARALMARQPQARLLLVGRDPYFADLEQVAAALNRTAREPVATLSYEGLGLTGCDHHPDLADHRRLADLIVAAAGRIAGLEHWTVAAGQAGR
ncbi:SGNH/GDSL hydrolase family protein [Sphingosinicella ginsenosidimutans]|uniref:Lipase n=1 Tax=Allosphingosinicella ginsenosidimutans TaxID=1176539 RepID=A0A5C6TZJ6_9SPHN|nr:SGNH/GDSL hydrolase family protein [Sphingosinicella ginsenosidimutans]TXC65038.1 lipase [Sphingosinicella ginsenosidimutans]